MHSGFSKSGEVSGRVLARGGHSWVVPMCIVLDITVCWF